MAGGQLADTDVADSSLPGDPGTIRNDPAAESQHLAGRARPPHRRSRRVAVAGVFAAMVLGGVLRALWADAFLPWDYHWDELTNVGVGVEMADDLSVDPGFYNYPALVFLAQSAVLVPATTFGDYDADEHPVVEMQTLASARVEEPGLLRAMRWATGVIPGIVTVAAAGAIGWVATRRAWVATLAAVVTAMSAIDLRFGIFVTPDALTGMASTLAALGAAGVTLRPTRRLYVVTGAAIGLAVAAKYNAAAVGAGLVAAHLIVNRRPWADKRLLVEAAAVAGAVFCITNLGAVLNPVELVRGVGSEANHYSTSHFGNQGASPLFNAGWLWRAFGLAVPLAFCSLLSTTERVRRIGIVLVVQSTAYFAFISLFPVRFARNLLPVTGPLAAAAAIGVWALAQRAATRTATRRRGVAATAAAVSTLAMLAVPVAASASAMSTLSEDPWSDAQAWIDDNVPEGSRIVVENRAPIVDDERYDVQTTQLLGSYDFMLYPYFGVDYVVAVSETFEPYFDSPDRFPDETASYERLLSDRCVVEEFAGAGRRIVIAAPVADC